MLRLSVSLTRAPDCSSPEALTACSSRWSCNDQSPALRHRPRLSRCSRREPRARALHEPLEADARVPRGAPRRAQSPMGPHRNYKQKTVFGCRTAVTGLTVERQSLTLCQPHPCPREHARRVPNHGESLCAGFIATPHGLGSLGGRWRERRLGHRGPSRSPGAKLPEATTQAVYQGHGFSNVFLTLSACKEKTQRSTKERRGRMGARVLSVLTQRGPRAEPATQQKEG